ncbi:MAG: peptide ABC transporter substrate-binding protein [Myxococcota bacterium]|nr:ABC transporter substrate-binding protein [Deltaproteobacteria bacterium]MCP4240402.1 peptide ABC transporter substrate-binding protein [bacterium]MDP6074766.1 peptide ABC transporter substrate-binding protein [Myxococcota bacterium]MDP6242816.1 peptide ABC transporter substrate-binding protein [Myxococcota bacterium]MDP7076323.1 peptide ABC transporter substrate-binding protein [Myxococcota bacterium]
MWRPVAALAAIVAVALAAVGLTFSTSTSAPADFRFVNGTEPKTLDPSLMNGEPEMRVATAIFEGLTRRDAKTLRPVPGVAESWEVSDDGLTWTFHLRPDARWSDGRPVTAGDFVYAWRRLLDPATGAEYAYFLHGLEGARAYNRGGAAAAPRFGVDRGVFAPDPRTLVVELEAPVPYFLELTSFFSTLPVPRWAVEAHGDRWFLPGRIVGNGPFLLESWRVGDRIRLVRNPGYWGADEVGLESVDVLSLEHPTTALNLYLSGEIDWLPSLYPPELVDVLRDRPDFYSGPGMIVYFYRLNVNRPPLDDPRVRQAIGLAIDRREITDEVLRLGQIPAVGMVPPGMPGYAPPESGLGFDVERARALLAEAGFPGGTGIPELGILYNTHELHRQIAEVIADQLRRNLGLRVRAYNQEWQSYIASTRALDYDIARAGWTGDYLDPNTFLDLFVTDAGNNNTGWGEPDYDALIAAASNVARASGDPAALLAAAPDPDVLRASLAPLRDELTPERRAEQLRALRLELLRQAETILVARGFPVIPIYFYVASGLVRPGVEGFHSELTLPDGSRAANLQDLHPLRDIRVERPGH